MAASFAAVVTDAGAITYGAISDRADADAVLREAFDIIAALLEARADPAGILLRICDRLEISCPDAVPRVGRRAYLLSGWGRDARHYERFWYDPDDRPAIMASAGELAPPPSPPVHFNPAERFGWLRYFTGFGVNDCPYPMDGSGLKEAHDVGWRMAESYANVKRAEAVVAAAATAAQPAEESSDIEPRPKHVEHLYRRRVEFEYRRTDDRGDQLESMSEEGWELVAAVQSVNAANYPAPTLYWKRAL